MPKQYTHVQWNGKKTIIGQSEIDPTQPIHLLIGFHGADSTPENMLIHGNKLNIKNAIAVYPEGPVDAGHGLWSWWQDGPRQKETVAAFLSYASKLLDRALHHAETTFPGSRSRLSLWGFSQGGAAALVYTLLGAHNLHKAASVCGFLPELPDPLSPNGASVNLFCIYGLNDDIVPPFLAEFALEEMKNRGHRIAIKEAPQGHEVNADNLQDLNQFFNA